MMDIPQKSWQVVFFHHQKRQNEARGMKLTTDVPYEEWKELFISNAFEALQDFHFVKIGVVSSEDDARRLARDWGRSYAQQWPGEDFLALGAREEYTLDIELDSAHQNEKLLRLLAKAHKRHPLLHTSVKANSVHAKVGCGGVRAKELKGALHALARRITTEYPCGEARSNFIQKHGFTHDEPAPGVVLYSPRHLLEERLREEAREQSRQAKSKL